MRRLLLPLLPAIVAGACAAQASGYRFIFPEFTKVYAEKSMWGTYQLGMGYDHDFNDRISMGFDAVMDLQRATQSGIDIYARSGQYEANYQLADRLFGLKYRTSYSFADNDGTSLYIGTFIGYRSFKQIMDLDYVTNNGITGSSQGPFRQHEEATKALIPMGLRLGVRGSLEGGFADLYTELGYVAGGGESVFSQSYFTGENFDLATLSLTVGLAYGFGW